MKIPIPIPSQIETAISALIKNGYQAYIVGGCVRDCLLNIKPKDYDITTNALPYQIISIFKNYFIIDKGLKHGTVAVVIDSMPVEITTYRVDGDYSDNRHPDNVSFTNNLEDDLSRRDFTINAIAYNHKQGLVDCFGGKEDISKKIIRCVGDPDKRFKEDALRIIRALRFSSVLNFSIEEYTALSIHKNKYLLNNIAKERIVSEFSMLICGENCEAVIKEFIDVIEVFVPEAISMKNFEQNNIHHIYDVLTHTLKVVKNVPDILHLKLAAFFHDIAKPITYSKDKQGVGHFYGHHKKGAEITRVILLRLKYDNFTIERVTKLVLYHDAVIELNENIIKRWLNKLSEEVLRELIILKKADTLALNPQYYFRLNEFDKITGLIDKVIIQEQCFSLKNLAVNGYDILKLGIPQNKLIGQILDYLLCNVIDGIFPNDEKILKNEAYKYYNSLSKN